MSNFNNGFLLLCGWSQPNPQQHYATLYVCLLCTKTPPVFAERSYNKKLFFRELTDDSENPTNTDGSYCARHSKSIKVDEYIAVVSADSRRSGAAVAVQRPQLAAKPGDANVASNWSGCYLRTAGCIKQEKKQTNKTKKHTQWRTCVAGVSPCRKKTACRRCRLKCRCSPRTSPYSTSHVFDRWV